MTPFGGDLEGGERLYLPTLRSITARRAVHILDHLARVLGHHPSVTVTVSVGDQALAVINGPDAASETSWDELYQLISEA